jgi:methylphosphotriester-DNA--protein-cysteine methyltransferase
MQDALVDHLPAPRPAGLADRATGIIDQRKGRIDISELADALAVTPRHLRRVFARDVGLSPKSYAKTVQLNEIVAVLHSGEEGAMHDLALAHGYYDQSHFVRDFTRRVGNNPGAFLSGRDLFLEMFLGRKSGD